MRKTDVAIIGGGIVGLATAYRIQQAHPHLRLSILEKENDIALHQTGRNSGVLHSGIYYKPGSLKARNCLAGKKAMEAFCTERGIPFERCGKVIVAVDSSELPVLLDIFQRGQQNGVSCSMIDADQLHEIEPHAAGIQAIHVPEAGIVDYRAVCNALRDALLASGAEVLTRFAVARIRQEPSGVHIDAENDAIFARYAVNCAGLYADKITSLSGIDPEIQIVPFRGEYFTLSPEAETLCRGLIYPVPDPAFPFLGVHFTRMIDGGVECGPNAVLAFAREGYTRFTVNARETFEIMAYSGFRAFTRKYWKQGLGEMKRSFSKKAFVNALKHLVPAIEAGHLTPAPAGVRAQAVNPLGQMADDFIIRESTRIIHVCNAPSPAATASLAIGAHVAGILGHKLG